MMILESKNSDIFYTPIENKELTTAMGVLIARGILRKENAREILIHLGIYRFVDIRKQVLHVHLMDEILLEVKKWKSPNDGIYKMGGAWWMQEATERCVAISAFFNMEEQKSISDILFQRRRKSPG